MNGKVKVIYFFVMISAICLIFFTSMIEASVPNQKKIKKDNFSQNQNEIKDLEEPSFTTIINSICQEFTLKNLGFDFFLKTVLLLVGITIIFFSITEYLEL